MIIGLAIAAAMLVGWGVLTAYRSRQFADMYEKSRLAGPKLVEFAAEATKLSEVEEIVFASTKVAASLFQAQRFTLVMRQEGEWVATQPSGPPPPPVPEQVHGLLGWFRHNPLISSESELSKPRFGAMRSPLSLLMETYAADLAVPLEHDGELIGVLCMALDRKPSKVDEKLLRLFRLQVSAACANVRLHRQTALLTSLVKEVDLAHSVELAMVPEVMQGRAGGVEWNGHVRSLGRSCSDFFDVYEISATESVLIIGDAIGRDLGGTMISALLKGGCDQIFREAKAALEPAQLLSVLNRCLHRRERPALASCFVAKLDSATGRLRYASAGHPPAYCVSPRSGSKKNEIRILSGTGPLLGDVDEPDFRQREIVLGRAQRLLLLTDGVAYNWGERDLRHGFRNLHRTLGAMDSSSELPVFLDTLLQQMKRGGRRLSDDQALVIAQISG